MGVRVSIIIPVYNVDKYLEECLDSILTQTLDMLEVICVNDCSPDDCRKILDSYSRKDKRVRCFHRNSCHGQAAARNFGMDQAKGEYIFFIDPDDLFFSPQSLEYLHDIALRDDADEVIGVILRWKEETEEREIGYHSSYLKNELSGAVFKENLQLVSNVTGCNKLLKHSFLKKNGIRFNPMLKKFEDNPFSWKTHLLARSISLTKQATYLHRQRSECAPRSIMQCTEQDVLYHTLAAQDILEFLNSRPEFNEIRHNLERFFFYWLHMDVEQLNQQPTTLQQKGEILKHYLPMLTSIPQTSLERIGKYHQAIVRYIKDSEIEKAWSEITNGPGAKAGDKGQEEIRKLQKQLEMVYNSTSWKVTAPLRKVSTTLRRFK